MYTWDRFHHVFPTHVGVFLLKHPTPRPPPGLPHACGGVSIPGERTNDSAGSSPRMWGCFQPKEEGQGATPVFPTHVGVFPITTMSGASRRSLPHACGGVSCSFANSELPAIVFPTHVGVFLSSRHPPDVQKRLPHACGGVSCRASGLPSSALSSPRMWGCFHCYHRSCRACDVFPTHVGVFLPQYGNRRIVLGLPHACGGVSQMFYCGV